MKDFSPVASLTLADAVEKKIYEYITSNRMAAGDPLPKEEDLAKVLNVSRNIVREALSRLRMIGLVETRKRKGMTLACPDAFIGLERMVSTGIMSRTNRKDLLEMRIILELGMCDYVFLNKTEKDMKDLEAIASVESRKKLSQKETDAMEIAFHSKLYEISGNAVLRHLQRILEPFFRNIVKTSRKQPSAPPPTHQDICRALRSGTQETFRALMHRHLAVYIRADL